MFFEYLNIFIFIFVSCLLSCIIFLLSYFLILRDYDIEKVSAYECGFEPFEDTRSTFDVRFYLVAILFIIFDLEITFLFPWIISIYEINIYGIYVMFLFLFILTIGFYLNEQKVL